MICNSFCFLCYPFLVLTLLSCSSMDKVKPFLQGKYPDSINRFEEVRHQKGIEHEIALHEAISDIVHMGKTQLNLGNSAYALKLFSYGVEIAPFRKDIVALSKVSLDRFSSITVDMISAKSECYLISDRITFLSEIAPDKTYKLRKLTSCSNKGISSKKAIKSFNIKIPEIQTKFETKYQRSLDQELDYILAKNSQNITLTLLQGYLASFFKSRHLQSVSCSEIGISPDTVTQNNIKLSVKCSPAVIANATNLPNETKVKSVWLKMINDLLFVKNGNKSIYGINTSKKLAKDFEKFISSISGKSRQILYTPGRQCGAESTFPYFKPKHILVKASLLYKNRTDISYFPVVQDIFTGFSWTRRPWLGDKCPSSVIWRWIPRVNITNIKFSGAQRSFVGAWSDDKSEPSRNRNWFDFSAKRPNGKHQDIINTFSMFLDKEMLRGLKGIRIEVDYNATLRWYQEQFITSATDVQFLRKWKKFVPNKKTKSSPINTGSLSRIFIKNAQF